MVRAQALVLASFEFPVALSHRFSHDRRGDAHAHRVLGDYSMRILMTALALATGLSCAGALALAQDGEEAASQTPAGAALENAAETLSPDIDAGPGPGLDAATAEPRAWQDLPGPVAFVCPFRSEVDYEPGEIECGFITVPENRSDPDSRLIRLHYVKIAATGEDDAGDAAETRDDPVIYLTGGPGVGVTSYVSRLREHDLVRHRDLYILEQRGIGASGNLCPYFTDTNRAALWTESVYEAEVEAAERMRACFQTAAAAGIDLSGYNTIENARDVRALREALGFEAWNVWGISYGSHLGQMLVREDPDGIRAIVLDAIVPNDIGDLMRMGRWGGLVLENVFSTCEDASVCNDLETRFAAALEQAKAEPVVVETDNTELYPEGRVRFGGEILAFAPFMMMYEQDEHPAIPAVMDTLITAVETDDMTVYDLLASGDMGGAAGMSISLGMANAIRCNDGYYAASARVAESDLEENPHFAGLIFTPEGAAYQAQVCVDEGLGPRNRDAYELVETDIPALIVNGAWDPVTPPPLAERVARGFSNGRYIAVPFAGHGPTRSMSECAGEVLTDFFDNPDAAALDAACLEEGVEAPVYLDLFETSAVRRAGIMATDDPQSLAGPGAWAGVSVLALLIAVFAFPLGWIARAIDRRPASELRAETGGARWLAVLAAASGLGFAALVALGGYQASEVSLFALLAGFAAPAGAGAWLVLIAGVLGLLAIVQVWRARASHHGMRVGTLAGITLTGLAAMSLTAFAIVWDLAPF
ncbi:alpha/beta fold hydrolase [Marinicauda pacifica]|uniref:Proline iminopeptidase n=2 Tax=Marinicauda pacifica TaxID=1133559 RepID=A0A4S2HB84_9PROT|nr:alpha/beta fold hydrolase [Marinicauda pacifica]